MTLRQLLDQWRERLATFLNLPIKTIGQIGGWRRAGGIVDVAVIQSLNRKQVVDNTLANYSSVIVDECHHLSAVSFEQVLRQVIAADSQAAVATSSPLVILKGWNHDMRFLRVGAVDGLTVMPKSGLGEAFGIAAGLGAFRPSVSIGMERNTFNAKQLAAAVKLRRTGVVCRREYFWEQRTDCGKAVQGSLLAHG